MYQRTVLIVEDEPLIRMMLADVLQDEGYEVIEAANALEAIAILGGREVDALITDVDMPGGLNGLDLTKFVAAFRKELPVIVTSGGHRLRSEQLPGNAQFIAKPYELGKVLEMLVEAVAIGSFRHAKSGSVQVAA